MIIQGNQIAKEIELELAEAFKKAPKCLVYFVVFGENKESQQFMKVKSSVAARLGITSHIKTFDSDLSTEQAIQEINKISKDVNVSGIVIQLPLPRQLDTVKVLDSVPTHQDIDMLSSASIKSYQEGGNNMTPPVAAAIKIILENHDIDLRGKDILIVGKGKLVGQPVAQMFDLSNIKYDMVDINTTKESILSKIKSSDIIISGVGVPSIIQLNMIKENVILIDAGTSEQNGKMVGDIDISCVEKSLLFSPTPGGVGPITVVSLFRNLLNKNI